MSALKPGQPQAGPGFLFNRRGDVTATDAAFTGSIPDLYDRHLGPLLFQPYAEDLATRVAALGPAAVLETAAGTGILTKEIKARAPRAHLVATDLNQAMLDRAADLAGVELRQADAQCLPFPDQQFDVVVSQFGAMFFPDRVTAYREARRVLRNDGALLFNVWDRIDRNPVPHAVHRAVADLFPADPPGFLARTPFGYHDEGRIRADLASAGFTRVRIEVVECRSRRPPQDGAIGLCSGSPLGVEIAARDPNRMDSAIAAATAAIARLGTDDAVEAPMSALVIEARG